MKRRSFLTGAATLAVVPFLSTASVAKSKKSSVDTQPKSTMFPRVFRANAKASFAIELADKEHLKKSLEIKYIRNDGIMRSGKRAEYREYDSIEFTIKDDSILVEHFFEGAQEHLFVVCPRGAKKPKEFIAIFRAYSLTAEMFALQAVKGEFHIHSTVSDGKASEADMLVECLKCGYDFATLGDHKVMCDWFGRPKGHKTLVKYGYQQISPDTLKNLNSSMRVFEAEEVHLNHYVHFHNFGGKRGVVEWAFENPAEYEFELEKRVSKFSKVYKSKDTIEQMSIADIVFDKVKEFGGISVFNHPMWNIAGHLGMTGEVMQELMLSDKCDAVEIANATHKENIQAYAAVQKYAIKQGKAPRVVGNSDAHSIDKVGGSYTIVFVDNLTIDSIKKAIRENKSLAVDSHNKVPVIMGDFDLVNYAYFLESEYFPQLKRVREMEAIAFAEVLKSGQGFEKFQPYRKMIDEFRKRFFAV